MKKDLLVIRKKKTFLKGFSLVEAIIACAVFAIITTSTATVIFNSRSGIKGAGNYERAVFLAEEGLEALRSMRDNDFSDLTNGDKGLSKSGAMWAFSGSQDTVDIFSRQINVATVDANTKKIVSRVSWDVGQGETKEIYLEENLKNWKVADYSMMVYSKMTSTPYYRIWNGTSWGDEQSATAVSGDIQHLVLKFARTRNEGILGTLDSTGNIRVQVWNGSSWGATTLLSNVGTTNDAYRGFDIEYERENDNAIVVYNNANADDPAYRRWDGTNWSSAVSITAPPTTGDLRWIELASKPKEGSNEIVMMLADSRNDIYGMNWNGSSWGTMGNASVWDATAANSSRKIIDVAYEQNSGDALFIWGDGTTTDQYYRIWNGTTLSSNTLLDIPAASQAANWVKLASRPSSDEIMYGVLDSGSDLNTRKWSGSSWDSASQHPEHDASTESSTSMNFDLVYETHASNQGKAWLVWGDGSTVSRKQWGGSSWGSAGTLSGSDDTTLVALHANPKTGEVFAGIYESSSSASDDILEWNLTNGTSTWSAKNTIWGGPITTTTPMFRYTFETKISQ